MGRVLVTGPGVEPLILEEAKPQCRLESDFADDDDYVESLIKAARAFIEKRMHAACVEQTWRLTLDAFPCAGEIELAPRLLSVSSVTYVDENGVTQTLATTVYEADADATIGRIVLKWEQVWPYTRCQYNAITITYKVGFGTTAAAVPDDVKQAIKLVIGHWYENREDVLTGTISKKIEQGVDALLDGHSFLQAA